MVTEKQDGKEWYGNGDAKKNTNGGMAIETKGREKAEDLYKDDVMGRVAKSYDNSIWKRGGMKRKRHMEDE